MKRAICLISVLLLLLCGCSHNDQTDKLDVGTFSYENDFSCHKDDPGVKQSGFKNTKPSEIKSAGQAVELARKECTVDYNTINVDFDPASKIYRISFYKEGGLGGNQDVYIDQSGITQLIVYGE